MRKEGWSARAVVEQWSPN